MRLSFRQGIVQHQQPDFLNIHGNLVDLTVTDTPLIITFADGNTDYLYVEQKTVTNAWSLVAGTDQWLYWDIDKRTGVRTFGVTYLEPVYDIVAPTSPSTDQHWFDVANRKMKVRVGGRWTEKVRVFACKMFNGSIPVSMSINAPDFTGTQAGLTSENYSGQILFDSVTGKPIKNQDGQFITTEDQLTTGTISVSDLKLASLIVSAEAQENLAAYTIVKFSDFGRIVHADAFTSSQSGQFGIIQESALTGDLVNVIVTGAISNPAWNWTTINAYLYVDSTGLIVGTPTQPGSLPIATVVDRKTIVLGVPQNNITNATIVGTTTTATETTLGTVRLNIPASNPSDPEVVGSNDPRLTDDRNPLAHVHVIADVTNLQTTLDSKVDIAGDTMTGALTLSGAPTLDLHAATKKYVDDYFVPSGHLHSISDVTGLQTALDDKLDLAGGTMTGTLTLSGDPVNPLEAATKDYVDNAVTGGSGDIEPNTQIVYGTGLGIDSSASFTYNVTTRAFSVNHPLATVPVAGAVTIHGATPSALNTTGGSVEVAGGTGNGTAAGGQVEILGGGGARYTETSRLLLTGAGGDAQSGDVYLNVAGATLTNAAFNGVAWSGGNLDVGVGAITNTGDTISVTGGNVDIYAQNVSAVGTTPAGSVTAGSVNISAGVAPAGSNDGDINLRTNNTLRLKITGAGEWQVGGSGGTSGYVLTSSGAGAAPTWQASVAPSEPLNQVVYGTGTGIDSSSAFTYNDATGGFYINYPITPIVPVVGDINIRVAKPSGANDYGGDVKLTAGDGTGSRSGGIVELYGGGGALYSDQSWLYLGGAGGYSGAGESYLIVAGANLSDSTFSGSWFTGGNLELGINDVYNTGSASGVTGGDVRIYAQAVGTTGTTPAADKYGGNVQISAGSAPAGGTPGHIDLRTGNYTSRLKITGTGEWQVGGSAGTSGYVLTSNGLGNAPTWQAVPAPIEPNAQLVYGTGTGIDSSSAFTFSSTTLAFSLSGSSATPGNISLSAASHSGSGNGGNVSFAGGAGGTTGNGGNVTISGGTVTSGTAGSVIINTDGTERLEIAGNGEWQVGGSAGAAGQVLMSNGAGVAPSWQSAGGGVSEPSTQLVYGTGAGVDSSSTLTFDAATVALTMSGSVAAPGNSSLVAASSSTAATAGANITIAGGTGNTSGAGGNASITGGAGGASGVGGTAYVIGGTSTAAATGAVQISTPNAATGYNSGNITLTTGTASGAGTPGTISFTIGSSVVGTFTATGNLVLGNAALATTANDGFLYIAGMAGTPIGTPSSHTGRYPIVFDSASDKLYVYDGSWIDVIGAAAVNEPSTQIVYGTGAGVDSSSAFTFNATTLALSLSGSAAAPGDISLSAAAHSGAGNGGNVSLSGGAGGTTGNGGNVTISGGTITSGTAGSVIINTAGTERLEIAGNGEWQVGGSAGTAGYALMSNGAGAAPTWQAVTPTFPLQATDGTEALPSYTFSSDTNTGLYRPAADTIGVTVNAEEVVRFEQDAITFSNGSFTTFGDAVSSKYILRILTTNDTTTELLLNGAGRMVLQNDSSWTFTVTVIARDISTGDTGSYELRGAIKRGANAAATAIVGTVMKAILAEDTGASTWDANVTADTVNGALKIEVVGALATDIRWVAVVDTVEVVG